MSETAHSRLTRREALARGASGAGALALAGGLGATLGTAADALAASARPAYAAGFTSLEKEVRLPHLAVDGALPPWLSGVLVRNGPAKFEVGKQPFNHWFDGLAMLHAFAFDNGRVSYANRFLRSDPYTAWKRDGKIKYSEFATDPCRKIFAGVASPPVVGKIPNANVSVTRLADHFVALTEISQPVRFDPRTLKTLGVSPDPAALGRMGTAHPHADPDSVRVAQAASPDRHSDPVPDVVHLRGHATGQSRPCRRPRAHAFLGVVIGCHRSAARTRERAGEILRIGIALHLAPAFEQAAARVPQQQPGAPGAGAIGMRSPREQHAFERVGVGVGFEQRRPGGRRCCSGHAGHIAWGGFHAFSGPGHDGNTAWALWPTRLPVVIGTRRGPLDPAAWGS